MFFLISIALAAFTALTGCSATASKETADNRARVSETMQLSFPLPEKFSSESWGQKNRLKR
ncbi:hypothetical protein [Aneurinibacillus terranovensis]|uniref:hypothetical protein n=1 Tax=Aneurinibacillus terranovensis TaxID=278991 RepID=UPI00042A3121